MRESPILFSAPMVRAILDGRKTQTRRVMRPQWPISAAPRTPWNGDMCCCGMTFRSPYGQPGDRLWVRETFALQSCVEGEDPPFGDGRPILRRTEDDVDGCHPLWVQAHYRATDPAPDLCCDREECAQCRDHDMGPHWRPSIHMPRWASRITLEITGVRVERLQDISEDQAEAEGIHRVSIGSGYQDRFSAEPMTWTEAVEADAGHEDARLAFRDLWESINGADSWNANPWVWVISFRRLSGQTEKDC